LVAPVARLLVGEYPCRSRRLQSRDLVDERPAFGRDTAVANDLPHNSPPNKPLFRINLTHQGDRRLAGASHFRIKLSPKSLIARWGHPRCAHEHVLAPLWGRTERVCALPVDCKGHDMLLNNSLPDKLHGDPPRAAA
jgi:hypothetical protein